MPMAAQRAPATRVTVTAAAVVWRRNTTPSTVISPPPSSPLQKPSLPIRKSDSASTKTPVAKSSQPTNISDSFVAIAVWPRMTSPTSTCSPPSRRSTPVLPLTVSAIALASVVTPTAPSHGGYDASVTRRRPGHLARCG